MSVRVEASVPIAAAAEHVFAAMVDLPSQERWMVATRLFALRGDVAVPAVGSRLAALTGFKGVGVLDTMEVTSFDPPHRWITRHTGGTIQGVGIFEVTAAGSGSVVMWAEELDLPFGVLGRVGWSAVKPAVRWGLRRSLARLARGVENGTLPLPESANRDG